MNIKSLSGLAHQVLLPEKVGEKQPAIKAHDATDRDADGRQQQKDKRRKVSEDEIQKIIESLRANAGVVNNNLLVEIASENETRVLYVKSPEGQIIRRIPEDQFYQLLDSIDLTNGRIINKAA